MGVGDKRNTRTGIDVLAPPVIQEPQPPPEPPSSFALPQMATFTVVPPSLSFLGCTLSK